MRRTAFACLITLAFLPAIAFSQDEQLLAPATGSPAVALKTAPAPKNYFAETFFLPSDQRLKYKISEIEGVAFVESVNRKLNTKYSVVTDFGKNTLKSRSIPGLNSPEDAKKWVTENVEAANFKGVEVRRLVLNKSEAGEKKLYWVGQKSFESAESAKAEIVSVKEQTEKEGGVFETSVVEAQKAFVSVEPEPVVEIKTRAQFDKEEQLALRFLDHLDIGNQLFGPFQGVAPGEPIIWQSFGETSWRRTNLETPDFDNQVGYWTNRIVFKGIRAPLNTIDPFVEVTPSIESNRIDYKSNLKLFAGVEWRPLARNPWFYNFRPYGGIAILEWMRNWRLYTMYGERKNIKGEIRNTRNHDVLWGTQIFYEWGIELPPPDRARPSKLSEYLEEYVWGEYFGNYYFNQTEFNSERQLNSFIANSSIIVGLKLPGIPLPHNPINDELALMPYLRFEHTHNDEYGFAYENKYFVGAGVRWMPFRNYRYKENEWLSKTKIFAEYVGVGDVYYTKQNGKDAGQEFTDLRFGVNMSSRRF